MENFKSFFSAAMLCTIWLILLQVLGNSTSSAALSVRLVNGSSSCSGTVQVLQSGIWRTVCYRGWDLLDANVVCRELGCAGVKEVKKEEYIGLSSGKMWMKEAKCVGDESSLSECEVVSAEGREQSSCQDLYAAVICQYRLEQNSLTHLQDAGFICSETVTSGSGVAKDPSSSSLDLRQGGSGQDLQSRVKVLLRIEVKTDSKINPNDPGNIIQLSQEMRKKLQISEPLSLTWKTQPDGKVFQNVSQKKKGPRTPCN